jgi:hypothetical protein
MHTLLGFQVREIYRKGSFFVSESSSPMGHAGLGGSVVLTIPSAKLITVTINPPINWTSARARNTLLDIFEEYGFKTSE